MYSFFLDFLYHRDFLNKLLDGRLYLTIFLAQSFQCSMFPALQCYLVASRCWLANNRPTVETRSYLRTCTKAQNECQTRDRNLPERPLGLGTVGSRGMILVGNSPPKRLC